MSRLDNQMDLDGVEVLSTLRNMLVSWRKQTRTDEAKKALDRLVVDIDETVMVFLQQQQREAQR